MESRIQVTETPQQIPFCCPVCKGSGLVREGFYSMSIGGSSVASAERCRSCDGKGIVWIEPKEVAT